MRRRKRHLGTLLVVALLLAAIALVAPIVLDPGGHEEPGEDVSVDAPVRSEPRSRGRLPDPPPPRASGRASVPPTPAPPQLAPTPPPTAPPPAPALTRGCVRGDAWMIDPRGTPVVMAEECGEQLCRDGRCQTPDPAGCGDVSAFGQCEGDRIRTCHGGRIVTVDCTDHGARCVESDDNGAICRKATGPLCDHPPRCVGDDLEICRDGRAERIDCAALDGVCDDAGAQAACVRTVPASESDRVGGEADCGPCGCSEVPVGPPGPEVCDGADNDGDGVVDNDVACSAVEVLAFLIADASGRTSYTEADVQAEVQRINALFADTGLSFRLADVATLRRPDWLTPGDDAIQAMAVAPELHPARGDWAIPLVFTDMVLTGHAPKLGTATLPTRGCGTWGGPTGQDLGMGVIVLSKARHPTTAAHELGHHLGLCHTHTTQAGGVVTRVVDGSEAVDCDVCEVEGDGICDTPVDPGVGQCTADPATCSPLCRTGPTPDVTNLMSYYHECRSRFSQEQVWLMRRNLAARRALQACAGGDCGCAPLEVSCPQGLSCHPSGAGWTCGAAGVGPEGAACRSHTDCLPGHVCAALQGDAPHCGRVCLPGATGCDCLPLANTGAGVCAISPR